MMIERFKKEGSFSYSSEVLSLVIEPIKASKQMIIWIQYNLDERENQRHIWWSIFESNVQDKVTNKDQRQKITMTW